MLWEGLFRRQLQNRVLRMDLFMIKTNNNIKTDRYVEYSENIGKTLNTLPYLIPSFRISKIRMCLTIDGISASIKHGVSKGYPGGRTEGWGVMTRDFCTYSISFNNV